MLQCFETSIKVIVEGKYAISFRFHVFVKEKIISKLNFLIVRGLHRKVILQFYNKHTVYIIS